MNIILGLGNPGSRYKFNRHNVGFRCIDHLAESHSIKCNKNLCQSDTRKGLIKGNEVVLAKPQTFVNLSGNAAICLLDKFHTNPENLYVIHDDMDLPVGRIRIKLGGKSGGHRGVKSIIDRLGCEGFYRVKIGISRPLRQYSSSYENDIVEFVLSNVSKDEEEIIQMAIERACKAIECMLVEGITAAMNKFNTAGG